MLDIASKSPLEQRVDVFLRVTNFDNLAFIQY